MAPRQTTGALGRVPDDHQDDDPPFETPPSSPPAKDSPAPTLPREEVVKDQKVLRPDVEGWKETVKSASLETQFSTDPVWTGTLNKITFDGPSGLYNGLHNVFVTPKELAELVERRDAKEKELRQKKATPSSSAFKPLHVASRPPEIVLPAPPMLLRCPPATAAGSLQFPTTTGGASSRARFIVKPTGETLTGLGTSTWNSSRPSAPRTGLAASKWATQDTPVEVTTTPKAHDDFSKDDIAGQKARARLNQIFAEDKAKRQAHGRRSPVQPVLHKYNPPFTPYHCIDDPGETTTPGAPLPRGERQNPYFQPSTDSQLSMESLSSALPVLPPPQVPPKPIVTEFGGCLKGGLMSAHDEEELRRAVAWANRFFVPDSAKEQDRQRTPINSQELEHMRARSRERVNTRVEVARSQQEVDASSGPVFADKEGRGRWQACEQEGCWARQER